LRRFNLTCNWASCFNEGRSNEFVTATRPRSGNGRILVRFMATTSEFTLLQSVKSGYGARQTT